MYDPRDPHRDPRTLGELKQLLMHKIGFDGGNKKIFVYLPILLVIILCITTAYSGAYIIDEGAKGIELRLGKYHRTVSPGLNFKIPYIDEKIQVRTERVYRAEFGFRTTSRDGKGTSAVQQAEAYATNSEGLMLTGDLNVVVVPFIVQFQVADPRKFLFTAKHPVEIMRDLAEKTVRTTIGDRSADEVINDRDLISAEAKPALQTEVSAVDIGIRIVAVEMQKINVPGPVQPSYNAVNEADQEKQRVIQEALGDYNKVVPRAAGQAKEIIQTAEGYALEKVNNAKGETARFSELYVEYKKKPEITKRRLFYESMAYFITNAEGIEIIDKDLKSILPMLNLGSTTK